MLGPWADDCADIPPGWTVPAGYEVSGDGVFLVREVRDGLQRARVTYAPLLPVGAYIDPSGHQMVELVWRDHGRWVNRVVARNIAKSGRRLITALGDAGLPAVDADAKLLERWLAAAEAYNQRVIPRRSLYRWLGWQADGTFVTGPTGRHRVEPIYDEQAPAIAAHHPHGDLESWKQAIKLIEPYPVAQMALYAGLAAPLLSLLRLDSFTIDLSGRSTRGKTTAAKIGLSLWADPTEKGDGLFSWRATMLAIEKRLNVVRGLPVVIDETRVVKHNELVDQVLYQVPKNHGQARGAGWPSLLPWSTIVISTGEQSALSFTTHQGAAARVLALTRPPFGTGGADNAKAAIAVGRGIDENYGLAGPAFVERLQAALAERPACTTARPCPPARTCALCQLRDRHAALTKRFRGDTDMSGRRAPMVAALALAAQLGHEYGIVPFTPPEPAVWQELFAAADATDNRPDMALEVVREWVASHHDELWTPARTIQPTTGWIGRRLQLDGDKPTVALLPERLKAALARSGYTLDAVLPGWQELGYLHKGSGRTPYLHTRKLGETKVRMYIFTPGTILADLANEEPEP
mgnify:CR=1 FL=1